MGTHIDITGAFSGKNGVLEAFRALYLRFIAENGIWQRVFALRDQKVAGSNPVTSTRKRCMMYNAPFLLLCVIAERSAEVSSYCLYWGRDGDSVGTFGPFWGKGRGIGLVCLMVKGVPGVPRAEGRKISRRCDGRGGVTGRKIL